MTDLYRGAYDAVREANLSHYADMASSEIRWAAGMQVRPSVLYRPALAADGTMWCALYGDDLQSGVAGFGDTPEKAMEEFDKAWRTERTPTAIRLAREATPDSGTGAKPGRQAPSGEQTQKETGHE